MLLGQVAPTEGKIEWVGDNQRILSTSEVISSSMLISPAMELPEELNLKEWFELHQSLRGFENSFSTSDLLDVCSFSKNTLYKSIATFSSGMKQRVKLTAGFFTKSRVLFLDEPLSNLDDKGAELYFRLISTCTKGKLLLIASNRPEEYPFCEQALRIRNNSLESVSLNN
jgi:ABC-type multidrug transport system ATPase subunit